MRFYFIFLLTILLCNSIKAQYYNKIVDADIGNLDVPFYSDNNNKTFYTASLIPQYTLLSRFDEFGDITAQRQIENLLSGDPSPSNRIYSLNDTILVFPRNYGNPLHLFSPELDSIDKREYTLPEVPYEHFYDPAFIIHNDSYLYWVGSLLFFDHPLNKQNEGLIIRLNRSDLEIDTVFTYPPEGTDIIFHHPRFDYDGNLSVAYERFDRNTPGFNNRYGMLKFDEDINVIQELELPFHFQTQLKGENYELENGNFVFVDKGMDTLIFSGNSRTVLRCLTPEGEQVWQRDELNLTGVGVATPIDSYVPALFNPDGNLVFASTYLDGSLPIEARLLCISPNGQVQWQRYFEAPEEAGEDYGGILINLMQDDEGNLTIIGYHPTADNGYNHWLIRTDIYGCVEPGCQLTSIEPEASKAEKLFALIQNPAGQSISVTVSPNLNGQKAQINVYDISGKQVHSENLVIASDTYSIPTVSFTNGMYLIEVKAENNVMQSEKVIVQEK